jgi:UDP-N-acetylglucosamine 2-epimerase (non-hydrolysing)
VTVGTNQLVTLRELDGAVRNVMAGQAKRGAVPKLWDGRAAERIVDALKRALTRERRPEDVVSA